MAKKIFIYILILFVAGTVSAQTIYVKADATGNNNGSSWTDAFTVLQSALNQATGGNEIWVAAGTYKPTAMAGNGTIEYDKSFVLIPDVKVYGGFNGTETSLEQRNWQDNVCTLNGDLDNSGNWSGSDACHLVISAGDVGTACLDGFTIIGGYAYYLESFITLNGQTVDRHKGGGIYCVYSSPSISNVIVKGNYARNHGGGMFNCASNPIITNVTITENEANDGGGMYNSYGTSLSHGSNPILNNVVISENRANSDGGGMYNAYSSPELTNVAITNNIGVSYAGGMSNSASKPVLTNVIISGNSTGGTGGGIGNWDEGYLRLYNVVISGNAAGTGGGIYSDSYSTYQIVNTIISGNKAGSGGSMFNSFNMTSIQISNSIIFGNNSGVVNGNNTNPAYSYCLVQDIYPSGEGNLNGNINYPIMFVNAIEPTQAPTSEGDYRLEIGSPCIDAGNNNSNSTTFDLLGNPRICNGTIDMGAYELCEFFVVTFDSQGGTEVEPITVLAGSTIPQPAAPELDGFTFEGWSPEGHITNLWDFATDILTSDTTLYACWLIKDGIKDFNTNELNIYPNPATNQITISELVCGDIIAITDLRGRRLMELRAAAQTQNIDISKLPAGVYVLSAGNLRGKLVISY